VSRDDLQGFFGSFEFEQCARKTDRGLRQGGKFDGKFIGCRRRGGVAGAAQQIAEVVRVFRACARGGTWQLQRATHQIFGSREITHGFSDETCQMHGRRPCRKPLQERLDQGQRRIELALRQRSVRRRELLLIVRTGCG